MAKIELDSNGRTYRGHVDSIAGATGRGHDRGSDTTADIAHEIDHAGDGSQFFLLQSQGCLPCFSLCVSRS
jgi:hypothetical protein